MIWIPKKEIEAMKKLNKDLVEESKKLDWGFKIMLQMMFEKGQFNDIEPVIRYRLKVLAYGK